MLDVLLLLFYQNCLHNTVGLYCDQCAEGFVGNARRGTPNDCEACPCPLTIPSNQSVQLSFSLDIIFLKFQLCVFFVYLLFFFTRYNQMSVISRGQHMLECANTHHSLGLQVTVTMKSSVNGLLLKSSKLLCPNLPSLKQLQQISLSYHTITRISKLQPDLLKSFHMKSVQLKMP